MEKIKVAIVRGKHLNKFEMQSFEPLSQKFHLRGFSSLHPFHKKFSFQVTRLLSPADFPSTLQVLGVSQRTSFAILNRIFVDSHYLFGLESRLRGFDIAHGAESYYRLTQQCLNAKRRGFVKKVVATVWENIPFNNEGIWGRKRFKKRVFAEIDHFIATTKQARHALIVEGCKKEKISVIYPGVDLLQFSFKKVQKRHARKILFVGRLEKEKGVWEILAAFQKVFLNNKHLTLRFCGSGSQELLLCKKIREIGLSNAVTIQKAPYSTMYSVYRSSDILICGSKETKHWKEQFGMVLVEAMATGIPIITTRSGAIAEIVGDAAMLTPEGSAVHIAYALEKLLAKKAERTKLAQKGRNRAVQLFDCRKTSEKIAQCYNDLIKI